MSRSIRRVRVAIAAVACAAIAGVASAAAIAPAGGAAPTTDPASFPETASTIDDATSTGVPAFSDGADARGAAEELLAAYIRSEFDVSVTDVACSVPASGDVGEQFACYALEPDDLVIVLRATIGPQRLIELELVFDQSATTSPTVAPDEQTTTAG
jgi:hypothetical protein